MRRHDAVLLLLALAILVVATRATVRVKHPAQTPPTSSGPVEPGYDAVLSGRLDDFNVDHHTPSGIDAAIRSINPDITLDQEPAILAPFHGVWS